MEHKFEYTPKTTATCTTPGYVEKKCENCGLVWVDELSTKEHDFVLDQDMSMPATCIDDGYLLKVCSGCGLVKKEKEKATGIHTYPIFEEKKNSRGEGTGGYRVTNWTNDGTEITFKNLEGELALAFRVEWGTADTYTYVVAKDGSGNKLDATCVSATVYTGKCLVCGEKMDETFDGYLYDLTEATGHSYSNTATYPTGEIILTPATLGYECTRTGCAKTTENHYKKEMRHTKITQSLFD